MKSKLDKSWIKGEPVFQEDGPMAAWTGSWSRESKQREIFAIIVQRGPNAKSLATMSDTDLLAFTDRGEQKELTLGEEVAQGGGKKRIVRTGYSRPGSEQFNSTSYIEYNEGAPMIRLQAMRAVPSRRQVINYSLEISTTSKVRKATPEQEKHFKALCDAVEVSF